MIGSLPLQVFSEIRNYFVDFSIDVDEYERAGNIRDWRNFCNCSGSVEFLDIKQTYIFYNLSSETSSAYLFYQQSSALISMQHRNKIMISRIISNIRNPQYQISNKDAMLRVIQGQH
jgi:hypothetical protein